MMGLTLSACISSKDIKEKENNLAIYATIQPEINSNPKQRYELIINTQNAPEDLVLKSVRANYMTKCRFFIAKNKHAGGGNYDLPKYHETDIHFTKVGNHQYKADVYDDYLLDKDYFNQGKPCGWHEPAIDVNFEPTPNPHKQVYNAFFNRHNLRLNGQTYYFNLLHYNKPIKNPILTPLKDDVFGGEHLTHLASVDIQMIKKF